MKIKKLSEDRVKVLVESEDINRYKVPYQRLSMADEESAEFIYELLFLIFEETGVSFLENAVSLEISPACGGNYYITVTRSEEKDGWVLLTRGSPDSEDMYIFALHKLTDLAGLAALFKIHPTLLPSSSALYKYIDTYYVVLEFPPQLTALDDFSVFLLQLSEYMDPCRARTENEGILLERGRLICSTLFPKNLE